MAEILGILIVWFIVGMVGYAIRPQWGFLLGFLLGPIGWLTAAVLRSNDTAKAQEKILLEATRLHVQGQRPAAAPALPEGYIPPPPGKYLRVKIAREGAELGEWSEREVAGFLESGELISTDHYFDFQAGQWLELAAHPRIG